MRVGGSMTRVLSRFAPALGALLAYSAIVVPAHAAWTFENTNGGNGTFDPVDPDTYPGLDIYSWVMVGSDLEEDVDVDTLTTITDTALADGPQTFSYLYLTVDDPYYDPTGYFINDQQFQISDDCGCSLFLYDTITLDLHAGDTFGFYIHSLDNFGGPAFLFVAPGEVQPAFPAFPEPASWAMMVGGFGLVGGAMRGRRKTAVSFA